MTRCAVFDLGSTSFQLLVTDVEPDGALTHVLRDRVILNLGAEVAATGQVPPELVDRALDVVARFRDIAERAGADTLLPVATAAFRDAANQPWLAKVLRGALGVPVRILAGDEEVRCTVEGIRSSVALEPTPWIALDLGGGSLEIAVVDGNAITWTDTFPLGAARLWRTMVEGDPMSRSERRELRRVTTDLLEPAIAASGAPRGAQCIVAGGTAGALARLLAAERWSDPPTSLNQYELDVPKLSELSQTLCALRLDKRLDLPGIDERRADILPTGAVVLATALALLGADRAVHSEWGLREGVVLREVGAPAPRSPADLRETSVGRLAATWGANDRHAGSVREHALRLFDETRALHDLGVIERELLGHAARVHDVGARISPDKHHKHGAYVVEHAGLRGFSPDEVALMACMVRFHRGTGPKTGYAPFGALTAVEREECRVLVGILRIAHGLGRGGSEDVTAIATEIGRRELVIRVEGTNPASAVADAEERADVLAKALRCRVLFDIVPVGSIR